MGIIRAVCVGDAKGVRKNEVESAELVVEHGVAGDAHAGSGRQISLLAVESVDKMRLKLPHLVPGDFAENLATEGVDLVALPIGSKLRVGADTLLEITQIGKKCHNKCNIFKTVGDCVMPREGVFARVLQGGVVKKGDEVEIL